MKDDQIDYAPRFLGPEGGRHFILQFLPQGTPIAHVVYIPPFVEEMNRCRALASQQARAFARAGYACTLVDFVGTGDSDGVLTEVTLDTWYSNLDTTLSFLREQFDVPLNLWGLRLGGTLALDYARRSDNAINNILLWQPVTNPKLYVTQVLRQRVATLMVKELPPETTKEIRQRLAEGEAVEVAGYLLDGRILDDLEAIKLSTMKDLCQGSIFWLDHVLAEGNEPGVATARALEELGSAGNAVTLQTFSDPPLWQLHERDHAPQLLRMTSELTL